MNDIQHEQLFINLSPKQAETASGGRSIDDGALYQSISAAQLQQLQLLSFNRMVKFATQIQAAAATVQTANGAATARTEAEKDILQQIRNAAHG